MLALKAAIRPGSRSFARCYGSTLGTLDRMEDGMARTQLRLLAIATLVASACSDPTGVSSGGVHAETTASSIMITNSREASISYMILDRATAARTLWEPCAWPGCPLVEPGERVSLPLAELLQQRESHELIVYWWHIVPSSDGGTRADSIRGLVVPY